MDNNRSCDYPASEVATTTLYFITYFLIYSVKEVDSKESDSKESDSKGS